LWLGACVVLSGGLLVNARLGAIAVEVAAVVHCELESVALPSENIITVCCGTTTEKLANRTGDEGFEESLPQVHAVDEWRGAIRGPLTLICERRNIPHELVHDLRKLDWEGSRASATSTGVSSGVGDVGGVVWRIEVLAVPASKIACELFISEKKHEGATYVGKIIV
jgi:hypothetical protein